jgi:hypothetical protein
MAIRTYYYKVGGSVGTALDVLLTSGAAPTVSLPSTDNPFVAVTVDDSHKEDLDDAMANEGFEFVAEAVGKEQLITAADSPYTPGQELIILADASAGPITIDLPALSTYAVSIRQFKVIKTDGTGNAVTVDPSGGELINGVATFSLTGQYASAEIVSGPTQWHVLISPSAPAPPPNLTVTTTDALTAGDIVAYDNNAPAQTVLADPDVTLSPTRYDAKGIATAAAAAGSVTTIYSIPGQKVPVNFVDGAGVATAPAGGDNGKRAYLSSVTAGKATLVAPGSGNAVVEVGILVGADGITTTPDVVFEFNVVALIA